MNISTETEVVLVKTIEYIKHKYPSVEVDSEIFYATSALHSQLRFRIEHMETHDVTGIAFDTKMIQAAPSEVLKDTLERMCDTLVLKKTTLMELQKLFYKFPIGGVLK